MMSLVTPLWYRPAYWSVGHQWLLLLLSSTLLGGGWLYGFAGRCQLYQQRMSDTQRLLQQVAALPPSVIAPAALPAERIAPTASLTQLLRSINQLTEQQDLSLLTLRQSTIATQGVPTALPITVEVLGGYQSLLNFLTCLGASSHRLTIDQLILQRGGSTDELILTLGLVLTECTGVP